jgi:hypothetical protein
MRPKPLPNLPPNLPHPILRPGSKLPLRIWEKMARIMIIIITGRAQKRIAIPELGSFTMKFLPGSSGL